MLLSDALGGVLDVLGLQILVGRSDSGQGVAARAAAPKHKTALPKLEAKSFSHAKPKHLRSQRSPRAQPAEVWLLGLLRAETRRSWQAAARERTAVARHALGHWRRCAEPREITVEALPLNGVHPYYVEV